MSLFQKIKSWGKGMFTNMLIPKELQETVTKTLDALKIISERATALIEDVQNPSGKLGGKVDKGLEELTKLLAHLASVPTMLADENVYTALSGKIENLHLKTDLNLADLEELIKAISLPAPQEGQEQEATAELTANEFTASFKKYLNKLKAKIEKRLNLPELLPSSLSRTNSSLSLVSKATSYQSTSENLDAAEENEDSLEAPVRIPLAAERLSPNEAKEFKEILLRAKTYIELQKKARAANKELLDLKNKATALIDQVKEDLQPLPELIKSANETLISVKALADESKRDLAAITETVTGTPKALIMIEDIIKDISLNLKVGLNNVYDAEKDVKPEYYKKHKERILESLRGTKSELGFLIYHLRSSNPDQTAENAEKVGELESLLAQVKQLKTYLKNHEEAAIKKREIQAYLRKLTEVTAIRIKYYDTTRHTIKQMDTTVKEGEEAAKSLKQLIDSAQKVLPKVDKLIDGYTPGSKIGTSILVVAGLALGMASTHFLSKLTEERTLLNFGQLKHVMLLAGLFIGAACLGGATKGGSKAGLSEPEILLCLFFPTMLVSMAVLVCAARFFYPAPERLFNSATNEGLLVVAAALLCGLSTGIFGTYNFITGQISFKTKPPETNMNEVTTQGPTTPANNRDVS